MLGCWGGNSVRHERDADSDFFVLLLSMPQPNVVFMTCGHICACAECSMALDVCPLCRADIAARVRLYNAAGASKSS